jgi:(p)ppGpp synthase/HD superfamily hydrolase
MAGAVGESASGKSGDRIFCDYAQTNIQLLNQLRHARYAESDLEYVFEAHTLAARLFASAFRGCGKPFLAHLVGTASILASLRSAIEVVAAGLLHAAYTYGEFGTGVGGITPDKREGIRRVVGERAEELIARYTEFEWNERTIPAIHGRIDAMDPMEREVLLIRLANELEDHLDLGVLYLENAEHRREYIRSSLHLCVDMAQRLGLPPLARAFSRAFEEVLSSDVPASIRQSRDHSSRSPADPPRRGSSAVGRAARRRP